MRFVELSTDSRVFGKIQGVPGKLRELHTKRRKTVKISGKIQGLHIFINFLKLQVTFKEFPRTSRNIREIIGTYEWFRKKFNGGQQNSETIMIFFFFQKLKELPKCSDHTEMSRDFWKSCECFTKTFKKFRKFLRCSSNSRDVHGISQISELLKDFVRKPKKFEKTRNTWRF